MLLHDLYVAIFAATAGFTASGILANLYRMAVKKRADTTLSRIIYVAVMIVAGPTVLFNNAAKSWREKSCSGVAFGLAAALAGYWSFAIGLLVLQTALAL
jgi:pilus assembly protein TadC